MSILTSLTLDALRASSRSIYEFILIPFTLFSNWEYCSDHYADDFWLFLIGATNEYSLVGMALNLPEVYRWFYFHFIFSIYKQFRFIWLLFEWVWPLIFDYCKSFWTTRFLDIELTIFLCWGDCDLLANWC